MPITAKSFVRTLTNGVSGVLSSPRFASLSPSHPEKRTKATGVHPSLLQDQSVIKEATEEGSMKKEEKGEEAAKAAPTSASQLISVKAHIESRWESFCEALSSQQDAQAMMSICTEDATWSVAQGKKPVAHSKGEVLRAHMQSLIDRKLRQEIVTEEIRLFAVAREVPDSMQDEARKGGGTEAPVATGKGKADRGPAGLSQLEMAEWLGAFAGHVQLGWPLQLIQRRALSEGESFQGWAQLGWIVRAIGSSEDGAGKDAGGGERGNGEEEEEEERVDIAEGFKQSIEGAGGREVKYTLAGNNGSGGAEEEEAAELALERGWYTICEEEGEVVEEGEQVALWQVQDGVWYICGLFCRVSAPSATTPNTTLESISLTP